MITLGKMGMEHVGAMIILEAAATLIGNADFSMDETDFFPAIFVFLGVTVLIISLLHLIGTISESFIVLSISVVTLAIVFAKLLIIVFLAKSDADDILKNMKLGFEILFIGREHNVISDTIEELQQVVSW
jgi:hypothetical protein